MNAPLSATFLRTFHSDSTDDQIDGLSHRHRAIRTPDVHLGAAGCKARSASSTTTTHARRRVRTDPQRRMRTIDGMRYRNDGDRVERAVPYHASRLERRVVERVDSGIEAAVDRIALEPPSVWPRE